MIKTTVGASLFGKYVFPSIAKTLVAFFSVGL